MTIKTNPYNPLDFFQSDEEIASYLNEAYADDDPKMFLLALGFVAKGMGYVAGQTGLNRESLYKALSGKTQPRWDTVQRVMKALHINIQAIA